MVVNTATSMARFIDGAKATEAFFQARLVKALKARKASDGASYHGDYLVVNSSTKEK